MLKKLWVVTSLKIPIRHTSAGPAGAASSAGGASRRHFHLYDLLHLDHPLNLHRYFDRLLHDRLHRHLHLDDPLHHFLIATGHRQHGGTTYAQHSHPPN